jgi:predicted GH43/DUF377 family glycosyl hydrolase
LPKDWSKAAAIFSEEVNNQYFLLFGDNHIWSASSDNILNWQSNSTPVISAREGYFDAAYVEMGPTPIKTVNGWLILYHGIDELSDKRTYCLGAALLSFDNPLEVIWRCRQPILEPNAEYEIIGLSDLVSGGYKTLQTMSENDIADMAAKHELPKSVFCCGAIEEGENIRLYYGAADTRICTATIDLPTIFQS